MWFSVFEPVGYEAPDIPRGWPARPGGFDRAYGPSSMEAALELMEVAVEVGFDSLTVAEHHYAARQLTPDPIVMAAAISQRIPGAYLTVMGTDLPLHNPVAVAERYAMLDNLVAGRLYVGLFRGTPNEYVTFGTNPGHSRGMFEEGVRLLKAAWTEPEPFGWEGTHYRYRTVAIWPQPAQSPHPRLLTSAGSVESAIFAARQHMDIGFFLTPPEIASKVVEAYRGEAQRCGWEVTPDNILYRTFALVAESDARAIELVARYDWGHMQGILAPPPERAAELMQVMGGVVAGGWARREAVQELMQIMGDRRPKIMGSPETVAASIRDLQEAIGFGRFDLITSGDLLPAEVSRRSIELFGRDVIPRFKKEPAVV